MNEKQQRTDAANTTVKKHMWAALAIGLLPFPWLDMAALTALQLKMLHSLAKLYKVGFCGQLGKSLVASLVGGGGAVSVSANVSSLLRPVPLLGLVGSVGSAAICGASTHAVGKVFVQHFESGGTFLDFDPEKVREHYAKEFELGKQEVGKPAGPAHGRKP